jgi:hypothetical protein
MLRTSLVLILLLSINLIFVGETSAQGEISSNYDQFKFEDCPLVRTGEWRVLSKCEMVNGPDFLVERNEHTSYFTPEAEYYLTENDNGNPNYKWAKSGLYGDVNENPNYKWAVSGHFGDLFANDEDVITIEWRVEAVDGVWTPFAAIFRTIYGPDEYTAQRLDIMKFGSDHACPIATVYYSGPESNVRAREIADASWGTNPCRQIDPGYIPSE